MSPTATKKRRPAPEPEVDELDDDDIEELADDEATDTAPTKSDIFGVAAVCDLIQRKFGRDYKPRELRTLLRKMAREKNARIEREVIAGNKARYEWTGPTDPEVIAILKAVKGGEVEAGRKEALDKLKERGAAKKAASAKTSSKKKVTKVEDDDDLEDFDED